MRPSCPPLQLRTDLFYFHSSTLPRRSKPSSSTSYFFEGTVPD